MKIIDEKERQQKQRQEGTKGDASYSGSVRVK